MSSFRRLNIWWCTKSHPGSAASSALRSPRDRPPVDVRRGGLRRPRRRGLGITSRPACVDRRSPQRFHDPGGMGPWISAGRERSFRVGYALFQGLFHRHGRARGRAVPPPPAAPASRRRKKRTRLEKCHVHTGLLCALLIAGSGTGAAQEIAWSGYTWSRAGKDRSARTLYFVRVNPAARDFEGRAGVKRRWRLADGGAVVQQVESLCGDQPGMFRWITARTSVKATESMSTSALERLPLRAGVNPKGPCCGRISSVERQVGF